jgi:hypothetical protein
MNWQKKKGGPDSINGAQAQILKGQQQNIQPNFIKI